MARPIEIRYTVQDGDGKQSQMTLNVASDTPLAEMQAIVDTVAQLLIPVLGGSLVDAQYTVKADLTASTWYVDAANTANVLSDIEEGAVFVFESIDGYRTSIRMPTFDESLIVQGSDNVNTADTDVAAFIAVMLNGIDNTAEGGSLGAGSEAQPTTSHDFEIAVMRSARESFVKSRR